MNLIGAQLGKSRLVECIQTGGMAEVYKAYQPDLDRYVAVKVISSELGYDPDFLAQFDREAKTLAQLEHPNILPIYDSGVCGDRPYLVVQYVDAGTLADRLGARLPPEEAVRIISQVGDALGYAHAKGIIHRDVKPSNILIAKSGRVLLADFGIAQARADATKPGTGSGTSAYMAPEQRAGKPVDGRADIFALGVLFYDLLSGKRGGEQNLLTRSITANRLPTPLVMVIACATSTNPNDRYAVAEDFVAAAQEALTKSSTQHTEAPTLSQLALEVAAIVLFALVGLGLIVYGLTLQDVSNRIVAVTQGIGCLVISAMIARRNRTTAMTMSFINAIILVMLGFGAFAIPAMLMMPSAGAVTLDMIVFVLPFAVPSIILWIIAAVVYIRDRRRSHALPRQPAPERRARIGPLHVRQTRTALINSLIVLILLAALTNIINRITPAGSFLHNLTEMLQGGMVFSGVILALGLGVWYVYSLVTATSEAAADQAPQRSLPEVKARRAVLDKARDYRIRIREAITRAREGPLRDRLQRATRQLDEWIACVERLTARLDEFDRDPAIQRDLSTVPRAVRSLEARLGQEQDGDDRLSEAVRKTLAARQLQLRALQELERVISRAELQVEETVAALGAVYSEVLLVEAKDAAGTHERRVQADIEAQVKSLRDLLDAIEDVKASRPV